MALFTDQLSEFLAEIEAVHAEPVEDLGQTESPFKAFIDLTTYLGASPRLLDAVVTADLLNGEPEGVLMALGAHLLISAGGTAARALRGTGTKGTGKPLQMASGKITKALRDMVSKSVGVSAKDISGNTVTGGMSGTLVRLVDEKLYHSVTPACRAAVSVNDLKDEIVLAEKTIEDWTISKLVKTELAESVKSGLLVSHNGAYKINWEQHGKREERKVAITEQTTLHSEGGSIVLAGRGSEAWLRRTQAKRVIFFKNIRDSELLQRLRDCSMEWVLSASTGANPPDCGWLKGNVIVSPGLVEEMRRFIPGFKLAVQTHSLEIGKMDLFLDMSSTTTKGKPKRTPTPKEFESFKGGLPNFTSHLEGQSGIKKKFSLTPDNWLLAVNFLYDKMDQGIEQQLEKTKPDQFSAVVPELLADLEEDIGTFAGKIKMEPGKVEEMLSEMLVSFCSSKVPQPAPPAASEDSKVIKDQATKDRLKAFIDSQKGVTEVKEIPKDCISAGNLKTGKDFEEQIKKILALTGQPSTKELETLTDHPLLKGSVPVIKDWENFKKLSSSGCSVASLVWSASSYCDCSVGPVSNLLWQVGPGKLPCNKGFCRAQRTQQMSSRG